MHPSGKPYPPPPQNHAHSHFTPTVQPFSLTYPVHTCHSFHNVSLPPVSGCLPFSLLRPCQIPKSCPQHFFLAPYTYPVPSLWHRWPDVSLVSNCIISFNGTPLGRCLDHTNTFFDTGSTTWAARSIPCAELWPTPYHQCCWNTIVCQLYSVDNLMQALCQSGQYIVQWNTGKNKHPQQLVSM